MDAPPALKYGLLIPAFFPGCCTQQSASGVVQESKYIGPLAVKK